MNERVVEMLTKAIVGWGAESPEKARALACHIAQELAAPAAGAAAAPGKDDKKAGLCCVCMVNGR